MSTAINAHVRYVNYRTWVCNGCGARNDHNDGDCQFCEADHECHVRGTTEVREGVPPLCDECKQPMLGYWDGLSTDGAMPTAWNGPAGAAGPMSEVDERARAAARKG